MVAIESPVPVRSVAPAAPSLPPPSLPPPALRPWSRIWRYGLTVLVGLLLWLAVSVDLLPDDSGTSSDAQVAAVGGILVLDLVLGAIGLALLPLRRRRPTLVATVTAGLTAMSASAVGPAALAAVSLSTHRRWSRIAVAGGAWIAATVVYELLYRPAMPAPADEPALAVTAGALSIVTGGLALVCYAICVAAGSYIGARRELIVTLRERAVTAEREQSLMAESAREAERTRIAREMHDVLAHRISLVAMHAGAMAYRTDLTREQTVEAAAVIQSNAHLALGELRQVLGVLRSGDGAVAEPPQPSLAELPALLADVREAGTDVRVDTGGLPGGGLPTGAELSGTVSRTAFRIVQEALTNACKHAPDAPVTLRLAGNPGGRLEIEVRNPVAAPSAVTPPGSRLGLVGLVERAALAGGALEHGVEHGTFVVAGWLPWV